MRDTSIIGSKHPNVWFLSAAWWAMMALLSVMFALPVLPWDVIIQACKILVLPTFILLLLGTITPNPQRFVSFISFYIVLWGVPAALSFLTPIVSLVIAMNNKFTAAYYVLLVIALIALSMAFVFLAVLRESRSGSGSVESHIFLENGLACLSIPDLQRAPASKGDAKRKLLSSPVLGLALLGYPLQKYLVTISGSTGVSFLLALLATPIAAWLMGEMICKVIFWVVPIWKYERAYGRPVYLKRSD